MIIFIYGEDSFSSDIKLQSIKNKYIQASRHDINMVLIDCDDKTNDFLRIVKMVSAQPFLAQKRLIVIKNLLKRRHKYLQEKIHQILPNISKDIVVIVYESQVPDKRTKMFKYLIKNAKTQEFRKLPTDKLQNWIISEIQSKIDFTLVKTIKKNQIVDVINRSSNDMWQIASNIEKISLYLSGNHDVANYDEMERLISKKKEVSIFDLLDMIAGKKATDAMEYIGALIRSGENEIYILSMIVFQYRNILIIKDYLELTHSNTIDYQVIQEISRKAKINPYVIKKTLRIIDNYDIKELKKIYIMMLKYDLMIKTGKISPKIVLDMVVSRISNNLVC
jgi:DNA polymerase-3 subunit delta